MLTTTDCALDSPIPVSSYALLQPSLDIWFDHMRDVAKLYSLRNGSVCINDLKRYAQDFSFLPTHERHWNLIFEHPGWRKIAAHLGGGSQSISWIWEGA